MVQKYQNEISPTIYYGISKKNNEKDLKIPNLQLPDWKHPYWMSLYNHIFQKVWYWYKQHTSQATNRPDFKLDILLKSVQVGDDNDNVEL